MLFKKKEEKNKVGRPKLADTKQKKNALIISGVCFVFIILLLFGSLISFNVIPKFWKLKGAVNTSLCSEVPARFKPYDAETNPEGLHEYGFTDPKFYSAVVSTYNEDSAYCTAITEEQLASITKLSVSNIILDNADGIQYLTGLTNLFFYKNNLTSIDVSHNPALTSLYLFYSKIQNIDLSKNVALTTLNLSSNSLRNIDLSKNVALTNLDLLSNYLSEIDLSNNTLLRWLSLGSNQLTNIDISNNTSLNYINLNGNHLSGIDLSNNSSLKTLILSYNKITSIDLSNYENLVSLDLSDNDLGNIDVSKNINLTSLSLSNTKLTDIDLSKNVALTYLDLSRNNLSSIDLSKNVALTTLYLSSNNLDIINLSNNTSLETLNLDNNKFEKKYLTVNDSVIIDYPNIITAYIDDVTYSINDSSIATYNNGVVEKVNSGSTTLSIEYKVSETCIFNVNYTIDFIGISSTSYEINYNDRTIDLNKEILNNSTISKFIVSPSTYVKNINGETLEIKDREGNIVDTYTFTNYVLYKLASTQYIIDDESKTVDLNGNMLIDVSLSELSISPLTYVLNINNDKLEIKDREGNIVDTYTFTNYILYKLTSSYYQINEDEKTIDLDGAILSNVYAWSFSITPSTYTKTINGNKLEIKNSAGALVDTYTFTNYVLYKLTSTYYTIDDENKTIDANKDVISSIYSGKFNINPSTYTININGNKVEIKDSTGNLIDAYKIINYLDYKLNSSYYTVDNENKTIDAKNGIFTKKRVYITPSSYKTNLNENILEILDKDNKVVGTYEIVNTRVKYEDAYIKSGFKDKNLYACVIQNYIDDENVDEKYLLNEEELKSLESLVCINKNISDATGIEKLTGLYSLDLSFNNIESIDLKNNKNLYEIIMANNKLTNLDVTKNISLEAIWVPNNNISKINGLNNLESLILLFAWNNNISSLNLNKSANMEVIIVDKNNVSNTLYLLKGTSLDYKYDIKLNNKYEIDYDVDDLDVVSYKDGVLKANREGMTTVYLSNEYIYGYRSDVYDKALQCEYLNDEEACLAIEEIEEQDILLPYFLSQKIKVYDITSSEYKIDKTKKIIDALNKDFDANKINLTLNGLSGIIDDNKFIIKDDDKIVDEYTINNVKQVVNNETVSNSSNGTKVKTNKNLISNIQDRKEDVELDDIYINSNTISMATLMLIKNKDRNIIVNNGDFKFTINGNEIEKIEGNLDLSNKIEILNETNIYGELKDNVSKGVVLTFIGNDNFKGKILTELNVTTRIKDNMGSKNVSLYKYNNGKLTLVAQNMNVKDNKLKFYIEDLGTYVLTDNELKEINVNEPLVKENNKLNKKVTNGVIISGICLLLLAFAIIGYINYKKGRDK